MHTEESEREKYTKMWGVPGYRRFSPAHREIDHVRAWLQEHNADRNDQIVTFGCGTGRLDLDLHLLGHRVRMIDIAENCLDLAVQDSLNERLTFETGCLWSDEVGAITGDFLICVDVLEHIPPEYLDQVIRHVKQFPHGYVNAALYSDNFGKVIGDKLHLSVHPAGFWHEQFKDVPGIKMQIRSNDAWMVW